MIGMSKNQYAKLMSLGRQLETADEEAYVLISKAAATKTLGTAALVQIVKAVSEPYFAACREAYDLLSLVIEDNNGQAYHWLSEEDCIIFDAWDNSVRAAHNALARELGLKPESVSPLTTPDSAIPASDYVLGLTQTPRGF